MEFTTKQHGFVDLFGQLTIREYRQADVVDKNPTASHMMAEKMSRVYKTMGGQ